MQATWAAVVDGLQCAAFCCRARKPFHPQKLYDFAVKNFFLQETELYEDIGTQEEAKGQQVCQLSAVAPQHCG